MPPCPRCAQENPELAHFCLSCGARLDGEPTSPAEIRKTVTIVFADVVGSTSLAEELEPESARRVLDRFFESMRAVVESHGGTVEKFIGDAVMAVFGIPLLHEDDALRAVRAAAAMRDELSRLNGELDRSLGIEIEMRVGVETGEVVTGDPAVEHKFVTGDPVNVAARLEASAAPGETRIGESTYRLVRNAVNAESLGRIALKGRAEPVATYRLLSVSTRAPSHRRESAFVGREHELESLAALFEEVSRDRASRLVTVIGAAGVGKSRLVEEFLETCSDAANIAQGRCLPYGDGITFWPLKEVIAEAAGLQGDETADAARTKIRGLVESAADADLIVQRFAETVGIAEAVSAHRGSTWAARRLFEEMARERPLVVVFDDIQWAETTFLDLVENVVRSEGKAPILVLCMARPELLDVRLSWASTDDRAAQIFLHPLSDEESGQLIGSLLDGAALDEGARARIVGASDGLPLFVEEMVAMLVEEGTLRRDNGRWIASDLSRITAPATIQALLAARLDRLDAGERAVLQRGSVEGQVFHGSAVTYLSPERERPGVEAQLSALVVRELIQPEEAEFVDEDAYRFHHLLLRDVAYESLRKDERVSLHERLTGWLEEKAGERAPEYDEILGYHLEQAYRYEIELRPAAIDGRLGERAAERLGNAGLRAYARGDWSAAVSLLSRAVAVDLRESTRVKLEPKLADAQLEISPAKSGLLSSARCILSWPVGHRWTVLVRHGDTLLRCSRCGREKLRWSMSDGGAPNHPGPQLGP